jgi:hypothetical protein
VPLSDAACELLRGLAGLRQGPLVFPRRQPLGVLAEVTLTNLLRWARCDASVHGMRSCFASWAQEHGHPLTDARARLLVSPEVPMPAAA